MYPVEKKSLRNSPHMHEEEVWLVVGGLGEKRTRKEVNKQMPDRGELPMGKWVKRDKHA